MSQPLSLLPRLPLLGSLLAVLLTSSTALAKDVSKQGPSQQPEIEVRYGQTYLERNTGPLKADVYLPKTSGPHPGVLVVHGGAWYMGTRAQLSSIAQRLAKEGFVAVAISYRFAPKHLFPAQIEDCKAAVRWMRDNAQELRIDPKRIGGFGYSAGGHLVSLLGATDADDGLEGLDSLEPDQRKAANGQDTRLQAVAAGGTPSDFRTIPLDSRWLAFWLGGSRRDDPEQYDRASPAAYVTADDPPMFLYHGGGDRLVPPVSSEHMVSELKRVGVSAELYIAPKVGHNFAVFDRIALQKSIDFLKTTLAVPQESVK